MVIIEIAVSTFILYSLIRFAKILMAAAMQTASRHHKTFPVQFFPLVLRKMKRTQANISTPVK